MIKLDLNSSDKEKGVVTKIRSRLTNVYSRIAEDDDYQRNLGKLGLVQAAVITVSAVATGVTNAFAHKARLGFAGALVLALLIMGFVEVFYFVLRHGLATVYKGTQRLAAEICYRTIQTTMVLNAAVLSAWVAGLELPPFLVLWNHWSVVVHFTLALIGVSAVRDTDPVTANKILELKAETAKQDLITIRKAAALGNPIVMIAAKIRGLLDGIKLARQIIADKPDEASNYEAGANNELGGRETLLLPGEQAETSNVTELGKHRRR